MCVTWHLPLLGHRGAGRAPLPHLLSLHHVQKIPKGRLLRVVEGQQGQRALHLRQALAALLPLFRQLGLRELQRCLGLPLPDQLDQVLLLVRAKADGSQAAARPKGIPKGTSVSVTVVALLKRGSLGTRTVMAP